MAITKNIEEYILEIEPLDSNIPSCSQYQCDEAGYYLYTLKDKWIFPFKKTRIKLNIKYIYLPNHCFGLITDDYINRLDYDITPKRIINGFDIFIEVRSRKLLPFKIRKGYEVAFLSVIHSEECHVLIS